MTDLDGKGKRGEAAFNEWLRASGLSFLYVNQDRETFAPLFGVDLKRPDFLVLLESIGLLAVDVKNYSLKNGEFTLRLEEELKRVMTFERVFRIPVWYAYFSQEAGATCWYWISALKAIEVGEVRKKKETGEPFVAIKLSHFERIVSGADLGLLYTHRLPGLRKIKQC